uniref:Uncharacterized protein n=2 Tax=Quercus lobata TaxID=97700 RepID=A0A7N2MLN4_QUELO
MQSNGDREHHRSDDDEARFDGGKELGKKVRVGRGSGEGERMEKLVGGLRNFPLKFDSGSTPSIIPVELFSLKHPREVSSEEMGLANDGRKKQRLTRFYGEPPDTSHRNEGWNMLRMLSFKLKPLWVKHLNCFTLDHRPLLLSLDGDSEYQRWRRKPFRFEAMWISDPECKEVVARAWDCTPNGTPMFVAAIKLKRCKKRLKSWSRVHFGNVKQQIKQAKDQLWHAKEVSTRTGELEEVIRIKMELNALFDKEEKMWQQRSKDLDRVLEGIDAVVTESMRTNLKRPFTSEEVGVRIKEMDPLKAPGLNGLS